MRHYLMCLPLAVVSVAIGCSKTAEPAKTPETPAVVVEQPPKAANEVAQPPKAEEPVEPFKPSKEDVPVSESLQFVDLSKEVPARFSDIVSIHVLITPEIEGWHAIFSDPDMFDSIHIYSEAGFDRGPNNARRGFAKGVINSKIEELVEAGLTLDADVSAEIKATIDDFDFSDGMTQLLPFRNEEGDQLNVRLRILFTTKAFCITTTSADADRFAEMNEIADGVSIK